MEKDAFWRLFVTSGLDHTTTLKKKTFLATTTRCLTHSPPQYGTTPSFSLLSLARVVVSLVLDVFERVSLAVVYVVAAQARQICLI